jgi:hypothetical protein
MEGSDCNGRLFARNLLNGADDTAQVLGVDHVLDVQNHLQRLFAMHLFPSKVVFQTDPFAGQ